MRLVIQQSTWHFWFISHVTPFKIQQTFDVYFQKIFMSRRKLIINWYAKYFFVSQPTRFFILSQLSSSLMFDFIFKVSQTFDALNIENFCKQNKLPFIYQWRQNTKKFEMKSLSFLMLEFFFIYFYAVSWETEWVSEKESEKPQK